MVFSLCRRRRRFLAVSTRSAAREGKLVNLPSFQ